MMASTTEATKDTTAAARGQLCANERRMMEAEDWKTEMETNFWRANLQGSAETRKFLARDHEQALDLSVALTASGVCSAVRRANGPVPGARIAELPRIR